MSKAILSNVQLRDKLISYNFDFNLEEFEKLIELGYYHVFNSFVHKSSRNDGIRKNLSDYLNIYELDLELRTLLFPLIIRLENFFKQRLNEAIIQTLSNSSILSSHHNYVVEYCIKTNENIKAKNILFSTATTKSQIVNHFLSNHNDIPIWAYMELLNLGKFINFIKICNDVQDKPVGIPKVKELFSNLSKFQKVDGTNFSSNNKANYIINSLRYIKSIRNNIAHNQPVIDNRFSKVENFANSIMKNTIKDLSENMVGNISFDFNYINFDSITDGIILIYVLYIHSIGKDEYSDKLLTFAKDNIHNNTSIHHKLHSNLFGSNYKKKIEFLISI